MPQVLSSLTTMCGRWCRCVDCVRLGATAPPLLTLSCLDQCCFRIGMIENVSPLLHSFALFTLSQLVLTLFSRATELEDFAEGKQEDVQVLTSPSGRRTVRRRASTDKSDGAVAASSGASGRGRVATDDADDDAGFGVGHQAGPDRPYGVRVLTRILHWLSGLMDPTSSSQSTRIQAMQLINILLEAGGESLGSFPSLVRVCQAELCKFLVQNSRTADLPVFALTLRVIFNLFNSMKEHLKVQLEVFFTSAHLFIADSRSATPQQRELALESLLEFCREPAMMVDLYVNYDCDVACTNLFDTLCRCLCRNAVPDGVRLNSLHVLSLEGILAVRCPGACTPDTVLPLNPVPCRSLRTWHDGVWRLPRRKPKGDCGGHRLPRPPMVKMTVVTTATGRAMTVMGGSGSRNRVRKQRRCCASASS